MKKNTLRKSVNSIDANYRISTFRGIQIDGKQVEESESFLSISLRNLYTSNTGAAIVRVEKIDSSYKEPPFLPKFLDKFWKTFNKEHSTVLTTTSRTGDIESIQKIDIVESFRKEALDDILNDPVISSREKVNLSNRAKNILDNTADLGKELQRSLMYNSLFPPLFNIGMTEGEEVQLDCPLVCSSIFIDNFHHQLNQYAKFMGNAQIQGEDLFEYSILGELENEKYNHNFVEQSFLKSVYAGTFEDIFNYEFDYTGSFFFEKDNSELKKVQVVQYEQINDLLQGILSVDIVRI